MFSLSILAILVTGVWSYPDPSQYEGQQVVSCNMTEAAHHDLKDKLGEMGLDVWGHRENLLDIRVKDRQEKGAVEEILAEHGLACEVAVHDLSAQLRKEYLANEVAKMQADADYFDSYHPIDEVYSWWKELAENNGGTFEAFSGATVEGRQMVRVEFVTDRENPFIYFQCQIHAREWISSPTCQYVVMNLIQDGDFLKTYNLAIVPIVNPDGFAYTWQTNGDRLWRKNRNYCPSGSSNARGVDLNRNYDDHWGQGGSSSSCSSDTYMGPSAASEFETQTTSAYFESLASTYGIAAAIDWHSYSQLILRPYGWTTQVSSEEDYFAALGQAYASGVRSVSGRNYDSIRSVQLYPTTGTASDWFFGKEANDANLIYPCAGFTIELRPASAVPGFQLPPSEIIPTGEENLAGIQAFISGLSYSRRQRGSEPFSTPNPPQKTTNRWDRWGRGRL